MGCFKVPTPIFQNTFLCLVFQSILEPLKERPKSHQAQGKVMAGKPMIQEDSILGL